MGFLSEKSFKSIGDFIGQFLHLDEATFNTWFRSFIRIRVRTNIAKPLVSQMWIRHNGGEWRYTEKFYVKIFEGFNPTSEKQYGAWLRAPTRQPSPVIGNRWVVPDQDVSNTTIHSPHCNSNEVMAGTIAVNPQADHSNIPDGLVILEQKRKRTEPIGPINEPNFSFADLIAKLDLILTFDSWNALYPNAKATSITTPKNDHIQLLPDKFPIRRVGFRFENLWLREAHSRDIMLKCWSTFHGQNLIEKIGRCSKAIWIWGKYFARNFQRRLDYWRRRMDF
nr:uncharacterized protein LOC109173053 [Ipomoea batatas]